MVCHKFNASIDTLSEIKPLVTEKFVFEYREKFIIEAPPDAPEYYLLRRIVLTNNACKNLRFYMYKCRFSVTQPIIDSLHYPLNFVKKCESNHRYARHQRHQLKALH